MKVKRAASPPKEQQAAGLRPRRLARRNRRKPLTLRIWYRGGYENDWGVEARGQRWAFNGHLAVEDVMGVILGELPRLPSAGVVIEVSDERMFDPCHHE